MSEERAAEVAAALSSSIGGSSASSSTSSSSLPPALDLRALCVAKGAAAWHLRVNCLLLSLDGTSATLTAASAAVAAALADTRVPAVTVIGGAGAGEMQEQDDAADDEAAPPEIEVEDDLSKATAVDASRVPVFVTVALASGPSGSAAAGDNNASTSSNSSSAAAVPVVAPFASAVVGLAADPDAAEEAASRSSLCVAVDASGITRASFVSFCGGGERGGGGGMSPAQLCAALSLARNVGSGIAREVSGVAKESIMAATA